jgi:redox-sensitive bicupin YhaK (pirin superfamily)
VWINQQAWFTLGMFAERGAAPGYVLHRKDRNGVYAFVIEGSAMLNGQHLNRRDALELSGVASVESTIVEPGTEILLVEVPIINS